MIENIFATPLYYDGVRNFDEIQNELNNISNLTFYNPPDWNNTHKITSKDLSSNSNMQNIIGDKNLKCFAGELDYHLRMYCAELEFDFVPYTILESWITQFEPGDYAHTHNHADADISGVYYYNTAGTGEDGNIFFETPCPSVASSGCFFKKYARRYTHKAMNGKILLFPGWLNHGVTRNNSTIVRNSLSFNIYFNRKYQ
jgi:uncharacterized protein (TIGR02466 family)